MNKKDNLGDRMKGYESIPKNFLMQRQPAIIRLDMKAGHSFTKGFQKPFDKVFMTTMQETMKYLCENIQGCVLGYTQSDEITLVLCDYQKLNTDAWFGYNVQKMTSVSASMATYYFNTLFEKVSTEWVEGFIKRSPLVTYLDNVTPEIKRLDNAYYIASNRGALFDSCVFTVPITEVNNYLLWRQQDATRNSIQALAQSLYSHKELEGINCKDLQNKMFNEKGINWNELTITERGGSCCIKDLESKWVIDNEIPIFSQNRDYVNQRIVFKD